MKRKEIIISYILKGYLLFSYFSVLTYCTQPTLPKGKPEDIVIFSENLKMVKEKIKEIFHNDTFFTPKPELRYNLIFAKPIEFEKYKGYTNLLILSTNSVGNGFKGLFYEKEGLYLKKKVFQKNDIIIGIFAPKEEAILSYIEKNKQEILFQIESNIKDNFKSRVYSLVKVDRKLKNELLENYGFTMDFPTGYRYIKKEADFVALGTHYPDRSIFVYQTAKNISFEREKLISLRDSLTGLFYDGDYVDKELTKFKETKFLGEPCVMLYGHWENEKMKIGGAFESFIFKKHGKFYFVDLSIFEPAKKKMKYIRWLEAIAETMEIG